LHFIGWLGVQQVEIGRVEGTAHGGGSTAEVKMEVHRHFSHRTSRLGNSMQSGVYSSQVLSSALLQMGKLRLRTVKNKTKQNLSWVQ
jgi:hypothetical protein